MTSTTGEQGARLAALHGRLLGLLAHLAGRAVRRRVELDDLAQEVWLRCLAAPERWPAPEPGDAAFWRYVAAIARHTVVDVARAARAARRDGRSERLERSAWSRTGAEPAAPGPGPATVAAGAEAERRLLAAFDRLTPEHRRVVGLRRFEGLSAREAAARLGRGEAAVHSLFRRALEAWAAEAERRTP